MLTVRTELVGTDPGGATHLVIRIIIFFALSSVEHSTLMADLERPDSEIRDGTATCRPPHQCPEIYEAALLVLARHQVPCGCSVSQIIEMSQTNPTNPKP